MNAMQDCKYIACSTQEDWQFVEQMGHNDKSVQVSHGINPKISTARHVLDFKTKFGIKTELMIVSSGGFWPNKAHQELVDLFKQVNRYDMTLVVTGYDNRYNIMPEESENVRVLMLEDRDWVLDAIAQSDLYIMHSHSEGFGLVLLESMLNKTPWAARNIAGAKVLSDYGFTYDTDDQLLQYLKEFKPAQDIDKQKNYDFVTATHMIKNTVDDILKVL
jgi:hypothetical protein